VTSGFVLDAGGTPTEGLGPALEVSFEDVGFMVEVAEAGLCREVTPVLSVSCSGRMGPVEAVFPVVVVGTVVEDVVGSVEADEGIPVGVDDVWLLVEALVPKFSFDAPVVPVLLMV
jgi:hypothetical protein